MDTFPRIKQDRLKLLSKKILNFREFINDQGIYRQIRRHILTDQNLKMTGHELLF